MPIERNEKNQVSNTVDLGNGGQYVNGRTHYGFKPYRGGDVGDTYKRVDIPGIGQGVWARLEDRGEDATARTYGNEVDGVTLPRYAVCVPGWGSTTIGSELVINSDEMDAVLFERLRAELS